MKYPLAHRPIERQPSRIVVLVAMNQRPRPSVSANLRAAPRMIAQTSTVPYSVPAVSEETMSPAPTPVAATTRPGPINLRRLPQVEGASPLAADSSPGLAASDMLSPLSSPLAPQCTLAFQHGASRLVSTSPGSARRIFSISESGPNASPGA